jgi:dephospho-CoA kinase
MTLPTVGLTGGIASGKSTVARAFAALGVPVIDADQLAREVVERGSEGLAEIVRSFGTGVLQADGSLDRKALARIVFADAARRNELNAITHPRIARLAQERSQAIEATGAPYVLYEAALIVENGMYRGMQALVVVATDPPTQLARLRQRDGMSDEEAQARIAAQAPLEQKLRVADFVIENSGSERELEGRVREVHEQLLSRFQASRT